MFDHMKPFPQVETVGGVTTHVRAYYDQNGLEDALKALIPLANSGKVLSWAFVPAGETAPSQYDPLAQRGFISLKLEDRPMYLPLRDMGA